MQLSESAPIIPALDPAIEGAIIGVVGLAVITAVGFMIKEYVLPGMRARKARKAATALSDLAMRRKLIAAADRHLREISVDQTSTVGSERSARELRCSALLIRDISPQAAELASSLADSKQREEALPLRQALGRELRE